MEKKIKIVRIIARLNVGGPARHVVWLNQALQNKEFSSVLLTGTVPEGEEDMGYFAVQQGVETINIPEMSRELSIKDLVSVWKVFRELRRAQPDIIHTHTAKAGTIGRIAGFFYRWLGWKKVKIVHTYHGHIFHGYYNKLKSNFFLLIEKSLARLATDKIIVISQQQFEEIHRQFGVGREKQFEIIKLGIDVTAYENYQFKRLILREEIGAKSDEILVGLVGRLTEIKNHELFLQVAKLFQERRNSDSPILRFVIIGDGHLRQSLEAESEKLGLGEVINFLGNRQDADVFYAGLDIVALTSLNEGTPLSLIEAMTNARPCISTAVGGVVDLLGASHRQTENGFSVCERGIKVNSADAEGFYQGLIHLAKDSSLQAKLEKSGREFILSNYSKERLISNLKDLYLNLVN